MVDRPSNSDLRIKTVLAATKQQLSQVGIDTPDLDARWLIEAVSGVDQIQLLLDPETQFTQDQFMAFKAMVARRIKFEPIAKIIGEKEFYGRLFKVSHDVLDPRPDTETLIDVILAQENAQHNNIFLDIGVGSGAIALTLLCERNNWQGVGSDISEKALLVAKQNSQLLDVDQRMEWIQTSWLEMISGPFDFIVSNPPYIERAVIEDLSLDVKNFDPHLALDGGDDGLDAYRQIAKASGRVLKPNGRMYLEIGYDQAKQVIDIFEQQGFLPAKMPDYVTKDLGGNDRVISLMWDR